MKIELFVREDVGTGDSIVLLHGIFGDGTQWRTITKLLQKKYRVIVVDVLGHGRSPRPKSAQYTPDEHATALRNSLERIGATKNLTVVGYSMGGAVALSYCAKYPDDIDQLYLISTPFYLQPEQMISMNYTNSLMFTKISLALYGLVDSILLNHKSPEKIMSYADGSNRFHNMIGAYDNTLDPEIVRLNIKNMIGNFDFAGKLAKISAPTTIYAGKKDLFIVQGQLYALKQIKPYIDIQQLDIIKVDHMLVQNLPNEITALISKNSQKMLHVGRDEGTGPAIVLLHGIESSSSYWTPIAPALAENHRVIALDLLGFGKSPKPTNIAYSLDDQVKWIRYTLDELGVTKFKLAGHSLGSVVALAYAAQFPKQVTSLTMFSPVIISETTASDKIILKRLNLVDKLSDTSAMLNQTAQAIGDARIRKYLPFVRSIENSIKAQDSRTLARKATSVPTAMLYGEYDPLVDKELLKKLSDEFKACTITEVPSAAHNFPMFDPTRALQALDSRKQHSHVPKAAKKLPPTFLRQIVRLSAPVLMFKSILLIAFGVLLFTNYAPYVLVLNLTAYVVVQAIRLVKGAFSLRNEGLSYLGYIFIAIGLGITGYALLNHPDTSLRIAVLIICTLVLMSGIIRVSVALLWTKTKKLKRSLLITGTAMCLAGITAFLGNLASVYVIVYALAIYLIARGIQYGTYATGAFIMAYVRGFNKQ